MNYEETKNNLYRKYTTSGIPESIAIKMSENVAQKKTGERVGGGLFGSLKKQVVGAVKDLPDDFKAVKDNVTETYNRGIDRTSDSLYKYMTGKQGFGSSLLQVTGETLKTGANLVGDAVIGIGSIATTEEQENSIKKYLTHTVGKALESETVQNGMAKYKQYKENHPERVANLEASLGFVEAFAEVTGLGFAKRGASALQKSGKQTLSKIGEKTSKIFKKSEKQTLSKIGEKTSKPFNKSEKQTLSKIGDKNPNGYIRKIINKGKNIGDKIVNFTLSKYNGDSLIQKAIKLSIKKGKNLKLSKEKLSLANKTVLEYGYKPTTLTEFANAVTKTKKTIWDKVKKGIEEKGSTKINLKPIAQNIKNMANEKAIKVTSPEDIPVLKKIAKNLESIGSIDIDVAQRVKQLYNSMLDNSYGKFEISASKENAFKKINKDIGEQINDLVENIPIKDLKKKYGALMEIEDDIYKRIIVAERQNPEGLIKGISRIEGLSNIFSGIIGGDFRKIGKGSGQAILGNIHSKINDGDNLIKIGFEKIIEKN